MCGTAPWQWNPETGGSSDAFMAIPIKCEGCAAKDSEREMQGETSKQAGVHIGLLPKALAKQMAQTPRRRPRSPRERARKQGGRRK